MNLEGRNKTDEILELGETLKAVFWPTPGFVAGRFDNFGFSAEGPLISVLAVPYRRILINVPQKPLLFVQVYSRCQHWG